MTNTPLDADEIVRLYTQEEKSVREIATRVGGSYGRVYSLLRRRVVMRKSESSNWEYVKIAGIMRERIAGGDWKPGHKILAQHELAKIFDVGQQTIREAISELRDHGFLYTVPNKGTFVSPPRLWEPEPGE